MRSSLYSDAQHTAQLSADSFQPASLPATVYLRHHPTRELPLTHTGGLARDIAIVFSQNARPAYPVRPITGYDAIADSAILFSLFHDVRSFWQASHDTFECNQGHGVGWKGPQEAWNKASPVPLESVLSVNSLRSVSPARKASIRPQWVGHDALLHHIAWVRCDPEDLRRQSTRPEVDCRRGQICVVLQHSCEDIVRPPPEAEECAEEERC